MTFISQAWQSSTPFSLGRGPAQFSLTAVHRSAPISVVQQHSAGIQCYYSVSVESRLQYKISNNSELGILTGQIGLLYSAVAKTQGNLDTWSLGVWHIAIGPNLMQFIMSLFHFLRLYRNHVVLLRRQRNHADKLVCQIESNRQDHPTGPQVQKRLHDRNNRHCRHHTDRRLYHRFDKPARSFYLRTCQGSQQWETAEDTSHGLDWGIVLLVFSVSAA